MANGIYYNSYYSAALTGAIDHMAGDIRVALIGVGYVPDFNAHQKFSDISAFEVVGTNYTHLGQALQSRTKTVDVANKRVLYGAANLAWGVAPSGATFSAIGAVVYKNTGDPTTSPLMWWLDFGGTLTCSNGEFDITWDALGVAVLS